MPKVLVASDAAWVRDHVRAALCGPNYEVIEASRGQEVRDIVGTQNPDLVIVDMQIANMGGMAVSIDLRLEESGGRLGHVPILLLLDREADRFLARSSRADAMLVKPIDPGTMRRCVKSLVAAAETAAPETAAPETAAPETAAPETAAPETAAPETAVEA